MTLRLGLIGDNIAASSAPDLHSLCGAQKGVAVTYDRLVPRDLDLDFDAVFEKCIAGNYRGINVTYPYKERAATRVTIPDPLVAAMGAVNTVLFEGDGPVGHNTDYTGFVSAYRAIRGDRLPGAVSLIGAGGVGRAVAFGLVALGASEIRLVDQVGSKAEAVAQAVHSIAPRLNVTLWSEAEKAASQADGIINCTPLGMVGYPGTPVASDALQGAGWIFEAIYTPRETQFLLDARNAGLEIIPGWELFFHQGVHAWKHFHGSEIDEARLRKELLQLAGSADGNPHHS